MTQYRSQADHYFLRDTLYIPILISLDSIWLPTISLNFIKYIIIVKKFSASLMYDYGIFAVHYVLSTAIYI